MQEGLSIGIGHTMVAYKSESETRRQIILNLKFVEMDLVPAVVFLAVLCLSTAAGMFLMFATFV